MLTTKKKLALNTVTSIILQITTIICGFVLPRLILREYGSNVNGLVSSITQFLSLISFLELGVGAVIQSSLYKPLANKNFDEVSAIITSGEKFFKVIATILLVYVVVLIGAYPVFVDDEFDWIYTALLIVAISISSFAQYYFGIIDRLLLAADQRGFIQYTSRIITLVLNTIACAMLVKFGATIHIVKLTTSLIYLARPLVLRIYINKHYSINRNYKYDKEPITQKWNGIAQHVAAVVLNDTDTIVLTLFSTLANVSIYGVYNMVLTGVKNLIMSAVGGIQSLMGELWAKQELDKLNKTFGWFEWLLHNGTVYVFGCTGVLIIPFVSVYTNGINDANYTQPLFAILITAAQAGHCLRLPYNVMILAAGHYKQTQSNYIVAAILNIVISVVAVWKFGLVGVAVGTLVAMFYQTIWMAIYDSKNLIKWPIRAFIKQVGVDAIYILIGVEMTRKLIMSDITYISWAVLAVKVAVIWATEMILVNIIFYKDKTIELKNKLIRRVKA